MVMKIHMPLLGATAITLLAMCGQTLGQEATKPDVIIENGLVISGDGSPAVSADVAITGDEITAIGDLGGQSATRRIDASGLVIAPGFIDIHNHSDDGFADPELSPTLNYLLQGVTTLRPGADGEGSYEIGKTKAKWEAVGMGVNAALTVGHMTVRNAVMGADQLRAPTSDELAKMQELVAKGMSEGAFGFSTQLEYDGYDIYVTTDELIELAKPLAEYDGFYISHMRNEADNIVASIEETIAIAEGAGVRANVTHIKVTGRENWGLMKEAIATIKDARSRGLDITADQYPFLQGAPIGFITDLIDVPKSMDELYKLSRLAIDGSSEEQAKARPGFVSGLQDALKDPVKRESLKQSTYEKRPTDPSYVARWGWGDFRIKVTESHPDYAEQNLADIIDTEKRDGFDIVADLVIAEPDILFASASQSPDDMVEALTQDFVMVSSDGVTGKATGPGEEPVRAHPRSFASQTIVLRQFVREEKRLSLEEAIRKMTTLPASVLQLKDRGKLEIGYKADIAVFDPETVRDNATYGDARALATGVSYVLVNGQIAVDDGKYTGVRAGQVLLKQ